MSLANVKNRLGLRSDSQGLTRLGAAMGGLRVLTVASGTLLAVLMARVLGPGRYGDYLYALSIAQILTIPVLSGLPALVTRQLAVFRAQQDWARLRGMLRWSRRFVTATALGVIAVGGGWLLATRGEGEGAAAPLYFWTLLLVLGLSQMQLGIAMLNGFERPLAASVPDGTIRPLLLLGAVAAFAVSGRLSAQTAMLSHLLAATAAAVWAIWQFRRRCAPAIPAAEAAANVEARTWLVSLLPLGLITFSSMLNARLDTFMLGLLSTKAEVALYGIAWQITGLVALGATLIRGVAGPRMARMWAQGDRAEIAALIRSVNLLSVASVGAAWGLVALFGGPAIVVLVGAEYARSADLAVLTSFIPLIFSLLGPAPLLLLMSHNQQPYVRNSLYMALINAGLNVALIPAYGATGAIAATALSTLVFHVRATWDAYRLCGIRTDVFVLFRGPA